MYLLQVPLSERRRDKSKSFPCCKFLIPPVGLRIAFELSTALTVRLSIADQSGRKSPSRRRMLTTLITVRRRLRAWV